MLTVYDTPDKTGKEPFRGPIFLYRQCGTNGHIEVPEDSLKRLAPYKCYTNDPSVAQQDTEFDREIRGEPEIRGG